MIIALAGRRWRGINNDLFICGNIYLMICGLIAGQDEKINGNDLFI